MLEPSHAWQQATAANNMIQLMTPRPSQGHTSIFGPPNQARMQGKPKTQEKTKPLGKRDKGEPTKIPENFFQAMPQPKGAKNIPRVQLNTIKDPHAVKQQQWLSTTVWTLQCPLIKEKCCTATRPRRLAQWENLTRKR